LIVIVDRNGLQITGPTEQVNALEPLADKFRSFGYALRQVDGHDIPALVEALASAPFERGKPSLLLAHTVKGKGISFAENQAGWHHRVPSAAELERAWAELAAQRAALEGS